MKIIFITEDISYPIDEGTKKFNYNLYEYLKSKYPDFILITNKNQNLPDKHYDIPNKLFVSIKLYSIFRTYKPDYILYSPFSSGTFLSFVRLFIINCYYLKCKPILINIQCRDHNFFAKAILRFIHPKYVVVFSKKDSNYFKKLGIDTKLCSSGVDIDKFKPVHGEKKKLLREKYGLGDAKKIFLHIGHINRNRNLEILKVLLNNECKVVIVGSTSTRVEKLLKDDLVKFGMIIINEYISCIEELYQMSDLYLFPVLNETAAIEFPLSVLEAMSCNLPVVATPFGSLPDHFSENEGFFYFNDETELKNKVENVTDVEIKNRECIIKYYSWIAVFDNLFNKLGII